MTPGNWPFTDQPNVAVITDRQVLSGESWIAYASHDKDDGAWQFHSPHVEDLDVLNAAIVSLQTILSRDPTICELANLPIGWCAERESIEQPWRCSPFQSPGDSLS
jgi:hypothetical protein